MIGIVKVTVLAENSVMFRRGLLGEHGLSFLVETPDGAILFDGGQSGAAAANAARLGFDASKITAIAVSHGHFDHTGGLAHFIKAAPSAKIYMHPQAPAPKFSFKDGKASDVGMPEELREILSRNPGRVVEAAGPTQVAEGIFVTGEVPRSGGFEDTGGRFFQDSAQKKPDLLPDDQSLFFEGKDGIVVLLGCAHAGVVNTVRHIWKTVGRKNIDALIGGMHLVNASKERMEKTVIFLKGLNARLLAPCHCTGALQQARLRECFPDSFADCSTGDSFAFELP